MAVKMTEEPYQQIRQKVMQRRLERLVEESFASGTTCFTTVEDCTAYLNGLAPPDEFHSGERRSDRPADDRESG